MCVTAGPQTGTLFRVACRRLFLTTPPFYLIKVVLSKRLGIIPVLGNLHTPPRDAPTLLCSIVRPSIRTKRETHRWVAPIPVRRPWSVPVRPLQYRAQQTRVVLNSRRKPCVLNNAPNETVKLWISHKLFPLIVVPSV